MVRIQKTLAESRFCCVEARKTVNRDGKSAQPRAAVPHNLFSVRNKKIAAWLPRPRSFLVDVHSASVSVTRGRDGHAFRRVINQRAPLRHRRFYAYPMSPRDKRVLHQLQPAA